jgi:hypothetical protein
MISVVLLKTSIQLLPIYTVLWSSLLKKKLGEWLTR